MITIEYRGHMGNLLTANIPDPSSIFITQHQFNDLMEACNENLVEYLAQADIEVLTLDLSSNPNAIKQLKKALRAIEDDK